MICFKTLSSPARPAGNEISTKVLDKWRDFFFSCRDLCMVQKNGKDFLIEGDNLCLLASLNRNGHKYTGKLAFWLRVKYQITISQDLQKEIK
jgi:hypothetical protein